MRTIMRQDCLIAIDIGNTNITAGLFIGAGLVKTAKIRTERRDLYERRMRAFIPRKCASRGVEAIVSSVVPAALKGLKISIGQIGNFKVRILGKDIRVPIKNLYSRPGQVGQDRLVNALAARELYGAPAVVIDFGTAVTFDCVSREGEYLGGLILPGIELSLRSLYERTALLPRIELRPTKNIIGVSTADSMRAGILFGLGAACDGLVAQYEKILGGPLKVIATGGNSRLIKRYARSIRIVDEALTLKGIMLSHP